MTESVNATQEIGFEINMYFDSKAPLVSIVIPCFNHEKYINDCIRSIIKQDYHNIELIIIDDGSNDGSAKQVTKLIQECLARFCRFEFRSRPNKGLAQTLNEALEWANGKYFSAIASDDLMMPNKTARLVMEIEGNNNISGVFSGCEIVDNSGNLLRRIIPRETDYSFDQILTNKGIIIAPSQLLRLSSMKGAGGYPSGLYIEDWYMWLAMTRGGSLLKVIPDQLVSYRQHESNSSKNAEKMFEARKSIISIYQKHHLYKKSLSQIQASAALDFTSIAKMRSLGLLLDAIRSDLLIVMNRNFLGAFLRLFFPTHVVRMAAKVKVLLQTRFGWKSASW